MDGGRHGVVVAPDLALEGAAIGGEQPNYLPVFLLNIEDRAEIESRYAIGDLLAYDHLEQAGSEVAPFDDLYVIAHLERHRGYATERDVGGLVVRFSGTIGEDDDLAGSHRFALVVARHARIDHDHVGIADVHPRGQL